MEYLLKMSGGLGGIQISGRISTSDLPPELRSDCKQHLQADKLKKYKRRGFAMASKIVDGRVFRLSIIGDEKSYDLYENELPEDLSEVLDALMTCIIRNKSAEKGHR